MLYIERKRLDQNEKYKIFITIILAQLTLIQAAHRSDIGHLLQSIPIGFVLVAWLFRVLMGDCFHKKRKVFTVFLVMLFAGPNLMLARNLNMLPEKNVKAVITNLGSLAENNSEILSRIKHSSPENEYVKIIDYMRNNTHQDDKLLVLPFLPSIYYFADRRFGGGQMLLAPGYFSLDKDQKRMIERLIIDNTSLVIEVPDASYDGLEGRKICNFASTANDYLDKNYKRADRIGKFIVRVRDIRFKKNEPINDM